MLVGKCLAPVSHHEVRIMLLGRAKSFLGLCHTKAVQIANSGKKGLLSLGAGRGGRKVVGSYATEVCGQGSGLTVAGAASGSHRLPI